MIKRSLFTLMVIGLLLTGCASAAAATPPPWLPGSTGLMRGRPRWHYRPLRHLKVVALLRVICLPWLRIARQWSSASY